MLQRTFLKNSSMAKLSPRISNKTDVYKLKNLQKMLKIIALWLFLRVPFFRTALVSDLSQRVDYNTMIFFELYIVCIYIDQWHQSKFVYTQRIMVEIPSLLKIRGLIEWLCGVKTSITIVKITYRIFCYLAIVHIRQLISMYKNIIRFRYFLE